MRHIGIKSVNSEVALKKEKREDGAKDKRFQFSIRAMAKHRL